MPWKDLERQGWIATAHCHEIRLDMAPEQRRFSYTMAAQHEQAVLSATDPGKLPAVEQIIAKHPDDQVLVIGTYLDQLGAMASRLDAPLLTGKTLRRREKLYQQIHEGTLRRLVVSKVANFAIDLPDVSVAIEVSGTFRAHARGAALGAHLAPQAGWPASPFLRHRHARHQGPGVRRQAPDVPHRARLQVRDLPR